MNIEEVLGKVSKLIISKDHIVTEEEVVIVAQKAQEILAEYNLSLADLDFYNTEKVEITEEVFGTETQAKHAYFVIPVKLMSRLCFCDVVLKTRENGKRIMAIVGRPHNMTVAVQMSHYLLHTMNMITQYEQKNRLKNRDERTDKGDRFYIPRFRRGLAGRLKGHITQIIEDSKSRADMYTKEHQMIQEWLDSTYSNIRKSASKEPEEIDKGDHELNWSGAPIGD